MMDIARIDSVRGKQLDRTAHVQRFADDARMSIRSGASRKIYFADLLVNSGVFTRRHSKSDSCNPRVKLLK
jgi:hypothetical protein